MVRLYEKPQWDTEVRVAGVRHISETGREESWKGRSAGVTRLCQIVKCPVCPVKILS